MRKMTPKAFFNASTKERVEAVARGAGTTYNNLRHIAIYNGACSPRLAKRLEDSSDCEMTLNEILFPEDYDQVSDDTAA